MRLLYSFTIEEREETATPIRQLLEKAKDIAAHQRQFELDCGGTPWPNYRVVLVEIPDDNTYHFEVWGSR